MAGALFAWPHVSAQGQATAESASKASPEAALTLTAASPSQPERSPSALTPRPEPPPSAAAVAAARTAPSTTTAIPWLDDPDAQATACALAPRSEESVSLENLSRSQALHATARRLLLQGKLDKSLETLCEAARLNPRHATLAFEVARASLLARHGATAQQWAERALALTPPDRRAHEWLADALAWQGNVEAARAEWYTIVKVKNPTETNHATMHRGAMLEAKAALKRGDYPLAERFLRRALAFDPESAAATTQLARSVLEQGHPKAAALWIARALALDSSDSERHVLAGDIESKLDHASAASSHYSRALELDPHNAVAQRRIKTQSL